MQVRPRFDQLRVLAADLRVCAQFSTRLPLPGAERVDGAGLARASWALPIAGALIGGVGAVVFATAHALHLTPPVAATLTLAATLAGTGCLHEDGLADTADGLGGGKTAAQKLEIMRDSRIGTYGVSALVLGLLLRVAALAALAEPVLVAAALIGAHAAARACLPAVMRFVPAARRDGLAAGAGRPPLSSVIAAALLGFAALVLGFGPGGAAVVAALVVMAAAFMAWLCRRQIGGHTGDVLGALEQSVEILVLLAAVEARG